MGLPDFILNLVALLLWLHWRSRHFDPLARSTPATLVGTLRPAAPRRLKGWQLLAGLVLLLTSRALLYWALGSPADWTPKLDLGVIVLAFRSDSLQAVALYSALSFLRVLIVFYFWLVALAVINRRTAEPDPLQKMVRLHLGRLARWPWPLQVLLPLAFTAGLWMALHPLLVQVEALNRVPSPLKVLEQGLVIGAGLVFTLKYLLPVFLLLHLIVSYIYLGSNPLWDFIAVTARNLLAPLQKIPLRFAKLDLAPLVGAVLLLLLLHILPNHILPRLLPGSLSLALWPQ